VLSARRAVLAAVCAAAIVRVATFVQVEDGSFPYFHLWAQSDMAFNDAWARDIAGGNVLGVPAPRPQHRWHGEVAAEAHHLTGAREPFDAAWTRDAWARWLGDRSYYQDPLYPYCVAAVYAAGGGPRAVWLIQSLAGIAIAGLLAWIACVAWDARAGLVAGWMAAAFAPLLFYEGTLVRAMPIGFLLVAAVAAAAWAARAPGQWRGWALAGVSAGLSILTYATSGLFALALGVWIWRATPGGTRRRAVAAYAAGLLVAVSPLLARNAAVGVPLTETSSARTVNVITALAVDAEPRTGFHISAHTARILVETGGRFAGVVRATLATHPGPGSLAHLTAQKLLAFWEAREVTDNVSFEYFLLQAPLADAIGIRFALVAPLAVLGLVLERRRLAVAGPLLIGIGCTLAVAVVFFPSSRVRFPGALLMIPLAAAGAVAAFDLLRVGSWRPLLLPVAAGLVTALLVAAPWTEVRSDLREADYGVGNEIALGRMRGFASDPAERARIAEAQLRTEPDDLRAIDPSQPESRVSTRSVRLAGSFAALHASLARARESLGDAESAHAHWRRAEILAWVSARAEQGP
jgi:hypothetical protein